MAAARSWATSTRTTTCATPAMPPRRRWPSGASIWPFRSDLYAALQAFAATPEAAALTGERARLLDHWLREFRRAGQDLPEAERTRLQRAPVAPGRDRGRVRAQHRRVPGPPRADPRGARRPAGRVHRGPQARQPPRDVAGLARVPRPRAVHGRSPAGATCARRSSSRTGRKAVGINRPLLVEALAIRRRIARAARLRLVGPLRDGGPDGRGAGGRAALLRGARAADAPEGGRRVRRDDRGAAGRNRRRPAPPVGLPLLRHAAAAAPGTASTPRSSSEYFPLEQVMAGMFELTAEVFGLTYRHIPDAKAWHPDVQLYEISDAAQRASSSRTPTPTCSRARASSATPRRSRWSIAHRDADGRAGHGRSRRSSRTSRQPSGDRPALLRHDEVLTLFHEFGHILHMSLSQAEFVRFSGADDRIGLRRGALPDHGALGLERGGAAPVRPPLRDRRARFPLELVDQLVAARNLDVAIRTLRQTYFGTLDLAFHGEAEPDDLEAIDRASYAVDRAAVPRGDVLRGLVRAPDGRLRRGLLRLPLVEGLRRRHVQPLPGGGHHEAGRRAPTIGGRSSSRTARRTPTNSCGNSWDVSPTTPRSCGMMRIDGGTRMRRWDRWRRTSRSESPASARDRLHVGRATDQVRGRSDR